MEKKDFYNILRKNKIMTIRLVEENEDIKMKVVLNNFDFKAQTEGKIKGTNKTVKVKMVTKGEDVRVKFVNENEDVKFFILG